MPLGASPFSFVVSAWYSLIGSHGIFLAQACFQLVEPRSSTAGQNFRALKIAHYSFSQHHPCNQFELQKQGPIWPVENVCEMCPKQKKVPIR